MSIETIRYNMGYWYGVEERDGNREKKKEKGNEKGSDIENAPLAEMYSY